MIGDAPLSGCPASVAAPPAAEPLGLRTSRELSQALRGRLTGRVAIMGVGNTLRGDDGVGSVVARKLRRAFAWVPPEESDEAGIVTVAIVDAEEIPESYIDLLEAAHPAVVVLVDAAELGAEPGALALIEAARLSDQTSFTHRTPLAPVARYLEQRTGATILFAGIQPGPPSWGEALSDEVETTANRLANILWDALRPARAESCPAAPTPEGPVC